MKEREKTILTKHHRYTLPLVHNCSDGYSTRFVSVGLSVFSVHLSVLCDMCYNLENIV